MASRTGGHQQSDQEATPVAMSRLTIWMMDRDSRPRVKQSVACQCQSAAAQFGRCELKEAHPTECTSDLKVEVAGKSCKLYEEPVA
eukprot:CAMPEP_0181177086 /NCGR_PEP_ID=MMETSP1096-20121128/4978_1 /TAXON_ID=156174 ORGANISM="Chrysochromulina ericina, Strain CCMP281" /NCGR_SAMPLE_ID=MMETSP1096 /ASSEMBLY_ACC=CAM_ASM_000453 /LENGTH=85 /DNA_ID=CAMNT_0023265223 /DNA_START=453 /DNA_END=712 /DNA_ORIENTATION=-